MTNEHLLQKIGFSQNEAKVYLAALASGLDSAQNIAKRADLQRTTTYSVLDYLVERGVVGKSKEKNKTRYKAESPDKLLAIVNDLRQEIQKKLPEMEAIYNNNETKPRILFYEGKGAIQNIYDDTLREKPEEILEWNTNAYFGYPTVDPAYISKRMSLGIRAKRIAGSSSRWQVKHKGYDKSELSETVIVPKEQFWPEIEVNIYNNKVAFLNYAEEMSIIIESKAIAGAMRQAYNLSWLGAKKIEVK
jgi:predicted transcriptional regulator